LPFIGSIRDMIGNAVGAFGGTAFRQFDQFRAEIGGDDLRAEFS
jgi:hypothetical protein